MWKIPDHYVKYHHMQSAANKLYFYLPQTSTSGLFSHVISSGWPGSNNSKWRIDKASLYSYTYILSLYTT